MKKVVLIGLLALFAMTSFGCAKKISDYDNGFTFKQPRKWTEGGTSDMLAFVKKTFSSSSTQEKIYFYTNGSQGIFAIAAGSQESSLAVKTGNSVKRMVTIKGSDWEKYEISSDTEYMQVLRSSFRNHFYTVIIAADMGSSGFDASLKQAEAALHSVDIKPFGFVKGIWDGALWGPKWVVSWFNDEIHLYLHNTNGISYLAGFIFGLLIMIALVVALAVQAFIKELTTVPALF